MSLVQHIQRTHLNSSNLNEACSGAKDGEVRGGKGETAYVYPEFPALLRADSKGRPWPQQGTITH